MEKGKQKKRAKRIRAPASGNISKIEIAPMTEKNFRLQRQIDERSKGIHLVHLQCQSGTFGGDEKIPRRGIT